MRFLLTLLMLIDAAPQDNIKAMTLEAEQGEYEKEMALRELKKDQPSDASVLFAVSVFGLSALIGLALIVWICLQLQPR